MKHKDFLEYLDTTNLPTNDTKLTEYKDFLEYLYVIGSETTTEEELDELYNEKVEIEFNHFRIGTYSPFA